MHWGLSKELYKIWQKESIDDFEFFGKGVSAALCDINKPKVIRLANRQ